MIYRRTPRSLKLLLGASLVSGSPLLTAQVAHAMSGAQNISVDGGPLGPLELSGGFDGFVYNQTGTDNKGSNAGSILGDTPDGASLGVAQIHLRKNTGTIQFNILAGVYGGAPTLGTAPPKANLHTFPISPFKLAFITIAPAGSPITISVGQTPSLEGYEDAVDINNANIFSSELWYVENGASRSVSTSYNRGPVSATLTFGDSWDTGVFNFMQGLATYSFNKNNNLNVFYGGNLGRTGLNAQTYGRLSVANYGANYLNSQMLGGWYSYTEGNLNLVPEVQYVYAKPDQSVGIKKFTSNFGAVVIADYVFGTSPYSLGSFVEYFDSVGTSRHSQDYWFIAPGAEGVGMEITPTWQYKDLFARVSAGDVYLLNNGSPVAGYGNDGRGKNVLQVAVEGGVLF